MRVLLFLFLGLIHFAVGKKGSKNQKCASFSSERPYSDGCKKKCNITMVQVSGEPGPLSRSPKTSSATCWDACLQECHSNKDCFAVYWKDGVSKNCTWYMLEDIPFVNRTKPSSGHQLAMKIPLSKRSCKLTTKQLLDDQYYLINDRIGIEWWGFTSAAFFRVRTTPKYYKMSIYVKEDEQVTRTIPGCEMYSVGTHVAIKNDPNPTICHRNQIAPGITGAAAKELCEEMDGHLATERFLGFFSTCQANKTYFGWAQFPWYWWNPYHKMGFPGYGTESKKVWVGLERVPGTNQFKWRAPEWTIRSSETVKFCETDVTFKGEVQTWAPGEPKNKPGYDCVYALKRANGVGSFNDAGKPPFPDYHLYTAPCDSEGADGFICGSKRQQDRGIPPVQSILDEYSK